ncbi:hypothetical protein ACHMW6_33230 [Pseudoduganella sp. UC29_106]|uniref:hypothetical protein n=1 Tax=Pseudoduganella sp. UC29_106 TaxID=3374553 RepID=UPI003758450F
MKIATIISLVSSVACVGVFAGQQRWILAIAFVFATAYTLLDKVIRVPSLPIMAIDATAFLFAALVVYEIVRKVFFK